MAQGAIPSPYEPGEQHFRILYGRGGGYLIFMRGGGGRIDDSLSISIYFIGSQIIILHLHSKDIARPSQKGRMLFLHEPFIPLLVCT